MRALISKYRTKRGTTRLNFLFIQVRYCGTYTLLLREQSRRILLLIPFETTQKQRYKIETKSVDDFTKFHFVLTDFRKNGNIIDSNGRAKEGEKNIYATNKVLIGWNPSL